MRSRGLRIGAVRGVPVYLTSGWLLISGVLLVLFTPTVARALMLELVPAALVAVCIPVLLAISVLLHELAHGLTAQRLGMTVTEYVLSLWGGHTAFHDEAPRPGGSALVAAVGPVTNGVLALAFWWLSGAVDAPAARLVLGVAAYTNVFVAVFNALPALPMDGGRLLEALVWRVRGDRDLGTLVAGRVGQGLAVVVGLVGVWRAVFEEDWVGLVWGLLVASMLWQGATAAVRVGRARRTTRDVDLGVWAVPVGVLPPTAPVTALGALSTAGRPSVVVLAEPGGRPQAWVQPAAVAAVPAAAHATTPLHAVAAQLPQEALLTTHHGPTAVTGLAVAARAGARFVLLMAPDGAVLGAVDVVDAGRRLPR